MGKQIEFYKIKIINWEKWNGGKKTSQWFKLSSAFSYDPKIIQLNNSEYRIFTELLQLAAHSQSNEVHFTRHSVTIGWQLRRISLSLALSNLSKLGLIEIQKERKKEKKERIYCSTEENFRLNDQDLELIYKKFPRKQGKQSAFKKLKTLIKSKDQLDQFSLAVDRFCEVMAKENRKPEFIPIFSTFVNSQWQDYLDPEVGTVSNSFADEQKAKEKEQFDLVWGDL